MSGAAMVDDLVLDLRAAVRGLAKQPGFLLTVIATLGLGIGGNLAMFGLLDAMFWRSLPYPEADRLVLGRVTYDGERGNTVSAPDYYDVREQATTFSSLSAFTPFALEATVTGAGEPERVVSPYVAWDLFHTLGVDPLLGRQFLPEEGEPGGEAAVMLSYGYWQRRFGGDRDVLGRSITLDGAPATVVGVLPSAFRFRVQADIWRPMIRGGPFAQARQFHNFVMLGRLAPGVSLERAQAEVDGITARLAELYPASNEGKGMSFARLRDALVEDYRTTLAVLSAAVLALLLVACANVAGVLLARGSARSGEIAMRSAMGAGRRRLVRLLMTENVLLAGLAAAVGLVLCSALQRILLAFLSPQALGGIQPGLSGRTLGAALGLSLVTVVLFGLPAALRTAGAEPAHRLSGASARSGGSREAERFRRGLVVTQVAVTVALLVVSGLLVRSLGRIMSVDAGFEPRGLLTAETPLPAAKYSEVSSRAPFFQEVQRRIAALPGVEKVGMASLLPIRDTGNNVRIAPLEQWDVPGAPERVAYQRMVLPGYFEAMGIPLLGGRDVATTDTRDTPYVVLLGDSLAQALFPNGDAIGRQVGVEVGAPEPLPVEVVGIVGDVAASSLVEGKDVAMYFPYTQRSPSTMRIAVRTRGEPAALAAPIRGILHQLDPDVPLADVITMEEVIASSLSDRRSVLLLIGGFALIALLLSAVGLYGLLAYRVALRRREIGVRMALGASIASVASEVVGGGLRLVAIGLALGIPASAFASRLVRGMLFGVGAGDPLTYAGVAGFFAMVATLACLLPARRAARIDPARAFHLD